MSFARWEHALRKASRDNDLDRVRMLLSKDSIRWYGNLSRQQQQQTDWATSAGHQRQRRPEEMGNETDDDKYFKFDVVGSSSSSLKLAVVHERTLTLRTTMEVMPPRMLGQENSKMLSNKQDPLQKSSFPPSYSQPATSSPERELREALDVQAKIRGKMLDMKTLEQEVQKKNQEIEWNNQEIAWKDQEIQRKSQQMKMKIREVTKKIQEVSMLEDRKTQLAREMADLAKQPSYRNAPQIAQLSESLRNVSLGTESQGHPSGLRSCPFCFKVPEQIFGCLQCDNWACGSCKKCPGCRKDFI